MPIPFIDLQAQRRRIETEIDTAIKRVVESGAYILGPQVNDLETALSQFTGAAHTVSCANGTDALLLALMAYGVNSGDAVFCPGFTFTATAEVIALAGATPVFVDISPDSYNLNPAHLEATIKATKTAGGPTPKAIIAVDLFGQPVDYPAISKIAAKHSLILIADCAQSFGATLRGKHAIEFADIVTTSFFPAKPLGCYGDGGALQTNNAEIADLLRSLRMHGQANAKDIEDNSFRHEPKYLNPRVGMNSRLDSIQAAILIEKLKIFPDEIERRGEIAARYETGLRGLVNSTPKLIDDAVSVWAQYTIEVNDRDGLAAHLRRKEIPSAVYYPISLHRQLAYAQNPVGPGGLPVSDEKSDLVISLPMHAYLDKKTQDKIIDAVRSHNG